MRSASPLLPAGGWLGYTEVQTGTGADLWYLRLGADGVPDGAPVKFLQTEFDESFGQISPDGRWIAYLSDEAGTNEVYVRPFPSGAGKWLISAPLGNAQATQPRWRRDGQELFYLSGPVGGYTMIAVVPITRATPATATTAALFEAGAAQSLFTLRANAFHPGSGAFFYSVTGDGQRFLVNYVDNDAPPRINMIVNWQRAVQSPLTGRQGLGGFAAS